MLKLKKINKYLFNYIVKYIDSFNISELHKILIYGKDSTQDIVTLLT